MKTDTRHPQTPSCPQCGVMMEYAGIRQWTSEHIVAIKWTRRSEADLAKPSTMRFKCPSCSTVLEATVITVYQRKKSV